MSSTDYTNYTSRGPQITTAAVLFLTLAWVSVIARCSVRVFMNRLFRIDDWLAVATLVSFTVFASFVIIGVKYGTGRHTVDVSDPDYRTSLKWWYCGEITYAITTCLLKVSIGAFLLQICIHKIQTRIIWTIMTLFSLFSVYYCFMLAFQCHPVSFFWMQYHYKEAMLAGVTGNCLPKHYIVGSTYAQGVLSAIVDWTLGIMPIFLVWNLQMNTRTKISVALILAFGAVGSLATVIRLPYIQKLGTGTGSDFLWDNTPVSIWSTVEPGMGITASSMACLRPLFRTCLSHTRHISSDRYFRGSSAPARSPRNIYNRVEEVRLHDVKSSNVPANSILVTTVVKTLSARDSMIDAELGMGPRRNSKSPSMFTGMDGWTESSTGDVSTTSEGTKMEFEPREI